MHYKLVIFRSHSFENINISFAVGYYIFYHILTLIPLETLKKNSSLDNPRYCVGEPYLYSHTGLWNLNKYLKITEDFILSLVCPYLIIICLGRAASVSGILLMDFVPFSQYETKNLKKKK